MSLQTGLWSQINKVKSLLTLVSVSIGRIAPLMKEFDSREVKKVQYQLHSPGYREGWGFVFFFIKHPFML